MDISFKCSFFFSSFNWKRHTIKSFLTACTPGPYVFPRVFSQMTLHSRYATRLKKYTVLRCRLSQKWLFSILCSVLQLREMDFISVFQRLCLPKKIFFLMLIIYMRQRQIILNICFAEEQAFAFKLFYRLSPHRWTCKGDQAHISLLLVQQQ